MDDYNKIKDEYNHFNNDNININMINEWMIIIIKGKNKNKEEYDPKYAGEYNIKLKYYDKLMDDYNNLLDENNVE